MPSGHNKMRVSMPSGGGGVNDQCHSNQTDVHPNGRHIMPHPAVNVILWGHFYVTHPDAADTINQLVWFIVGGRYMNNLSQYGVGRGSLVNVSVIDTDNNAPAPHSLSDSEAQDQLIKWLRAGTISPAPAVNERNLLYLLFPPLTTILEPKDVGFGGYHRFGKFNNDSDNDDLFWAIFRVPSNPSSGADVIRSISGVVSHEMTESFTDRDGDGYLTKNDCEISDLCEALSDFEYVGFNVERYWSNWDHGCIRGDDPVRVSRFLKALAHSETPPAGVRWTGMPRIGIEEIAAKMRSQ